MSIKQIQKRHTETLAITELFQPSLLFKGYRCIPFLRDHLMKIKFFLKTIY